VTFRYRDGRTGTTKHCVLEAVTFLGRFLQHVLPDGFAKVRHYGLFSPSRKNLLAAARAQLATPSASPSPLPPNDAPPLPAPPPAPIPRCAVCKIGVLHIVETLPRWHPPP
jgi:hypothetical protein